MAIFDIEHQSFFIVSNLDKNDSDDSEEEEEDLDKVTARILKYLEMNINEMIIRK